MGHKHATPQGLIGMLAPAEGFRRIHNLEPGLPPKTTDNDKPYYLVRFGSGPETVEKLAFDAQRAESFGFPHGVSVRLRNRISGSDKANKKAIVFDVLLHFNVIKTGAQLDHYTVVLCFFYGSLSSG